jgi:diguanylate cyclase (GGDEF)-like protein
MADHPEPEPGLDVAGPLWPHNRGSASLGRRLVLATLLFCLCFTLGTVAVRTWFAWNNSLKAMNAELQLIDQVFQGTLAKAVWEMDRDALKEQLDSVAAAAPVGQVTLRVLRPGRDPEMLERRRREQADDDYAPRLHRDLAITPYPGASEQVGDLTIIGDPSLLWQRLWKEVAVIILTQVIQSLALAGLIMAMFNRTVTVHVRHVARHLSQLTPATLERHLRLRRQRRDGDELDMLESGVNQVQGKLATYLQRQHEDELALAASRDQLVELVEQRTAELRAANVRLEALTRFDPLTGLANRRHFDELKALEFNRALRNQHPLSVLMCDIDHFKPYNDSHGHAMGDQCLSNVAMVMSSVFTRSGELVARLGGEEFAILLPGCDLLQAHEAAERLQAAMAAAQLAHGASPVSPYMTLSIGIAELDPTTMDRFDQLLQRADQALYRAKRQGRARSVS